MCIYRKGQCQCLSIFYPFYYLYYLAAARGPGPPCEVARDTLLWAWGQSQTFFERKDHFLIFLIRKMSHLVILITAGVGQPGAVWTVQ